MTLLHHFSAPVLTDATVLTHSNDTGLSEDNGTELNVNMIIMLVLLAMLFILSTCVNTIILIAFYKKKSLRTISNRYVCYGQAVTIL